MNSNNNHKYNQEGLLSPKKGVKRRIVGHDYGLAAAAESLWGDDLKDYKTSVYSRREADYEHTKDVISVKENKLNEEKAALKKQYGFFARLFNKNYKAKMEKINEGLKNVQTSYKVAKQEAQYYVLKEFEDKGLTMTKKEKKALAKIVKETAPALRGIWDSTRKNEKETIARQDEAYSSYEYIARGEKRPDHLSATKQLDLKEHIHQPKVQEAPLKQEPQNEKSIEKEQKVQEGPEL